ncbi:sugar phosphate isomerase/epimerase family protein [Pseudactinotalea sp. Z1748]|uniref:sugar phosphate isomerase/epimerase family protein n=1 Tax=Pseudactinotalea sp. Z1748 TaxID=3413027 RepID=UPI003C7B7AE1
MWTLSGFADEIDADFTRQCTVTRELGLNFIEIRSAWDTGVLDLTDDQLRQARDILTDHSLGVSAIGSPIGKIFIDDDFPAHLDRMHRAIEVAHHFRAPYIRIFSFFQRPEIDPDEAREEVIRRIRALVELAEPAGVTLLHENEMEIYGDVPERCLDLVTAVDSHRFKLAWDPANFVQAGIRPHTDAYEQLRPHLEYVQIKDARASDGVVVPAGEGDGEVLETIRSLRADDFEGFFSLEPHLESHTTSADVTGTDLFRTAWKAFTDLLEQESIPYA